MKLFVYESKYVNICRAISKKKGTKKEQIEQDVILKKRTFYVINDVQK